MTSEKGRNKFNISEIKLKDRNNGQASCDISYSINSENEINKKIGLNVKVSNKKIDFIYEIN